MLSLSFKKFVIKNDEEYGSDFREILNIATYIIITFGAATPFESFDVSNGIKKKFLSPNNPTFFSKNDAESVVVYHNGGLLQLLLNTLIQDVLFWELTKSTRCGKRRDMITLVRKYFYYGIKKIMGANPAFGLSGLKNYSLPEYATLVRAM